jgi:DnaJ-class molecular chaperone
MPNVSGRGRGDLFAAVTVAMPKKLSREQKALIEQLGQLMPQAEIDPNAGTAKTEEDRPFFERVKDIFG